MCYTDMIECMILRKSETIILSHVSIQPNSIVLWFTSEWVYVGVTEKNIV